MTFIPIKIYNEFPIANHDIPIFVLKKIMSELLDLSTRLLEKKNLGITAMRILVIQEFLKAPQAISLSELEHKLNDSDRSTLYRTLKTFEKKGIIHSIQENNSTQYLLCNEHCTEQHHQDTHLHFFCITCKKTTCLNEVKFNSLHLPNDYTMIELKCVAHGICPDCKTLQ